MPIWGGRGVPVGAGPHWSKIPKKHVPAHAQGLGGGGRAAAVTPWMCSKWPDTLLGGSGWPGGSRPRGRSPCRLSAAAPAAASSRRSPVLVPRHCSRGPGPPAPGHALSPHSSAWGGGGGRNKQGRQNVKNKRLYSKIRKPPAAEQSQPQPGVAERREEPATLCEFSNEAARVVAVPRWGYGHRPTAPARVPQRGDNQHQRPQQRQERTHHAPAASYLAGRGAVPENIVGRRFPLAEPSILLPPVTRTWAWQGAHTRGC